MSKKYTLKVSSVLAETPECVSIGLEIPVHLKDDFDYEPGQYLTLEVALDGKKERRAYSLSSSPITDTELVVSVKKVEQGLVSTYLNDNCKVGDEIEVLTPDGRFIADLNEGNEKHYFLIGAGSGITPLLSIIKSVLFIETKSKITLLYGNREEGSIIFNEVLEALSAKNSERFNIVHTLSNPGSAWAGEKGRISPDLIETVLQEKIKQGEKLECYLCGPGDLIQLSEAKLIDLGLNEEQIKREYFTKTDGSDPNASSTAVPFEGEAKLTIILENEKHELVLGQGETILDAAIDAGLDAPYSCKIAACCTCRAKVVEGQVIMGDDDILTDDEKEEGFILTCQSTAASASLSISYDED